MQRTVQRADAVTACAACHHPREAHAKWQTSPSSPLSLRAGCGVRGCSCRAYVGLVWEMSPLPGSGTKRTVRAT